MAYGICRVEKVKTLAALRGRAAHNAREQETANADPSLAHQNQVLGARSSEQALAMVREKLAEVTEKTGRKLRRDAVPAVEMLLTYSPDWGGDPRRFRDKASRFAVEHFGKENVVQIAYHADEKTPHLHVLAVPRTEDGKLSAKRVVGNRQDLQILQDKFHNKVGH